MASIPCVAVDAPAEQKQALLAQAGCLVVTGAADARTVDALTTEMAPHMADAHVAAEDEPEEFYPGHTRRVTALVARLVDLIHLTMQRLTNS